jgi:LysM domain
MKRRLWAGLACAALVVGLRPCLGQDAAAQQAAAIADRQAAEERYTRLNAAVEGLVEAQAVLQRRVRDLSAELRAAREENANLQARYVTHDDIKRLVEKIREVDEKRASDRNLILEELQKLLKAPAAPAPAPAPQGNTAPPAATAKDLEKGYEHTVEKGQTLLLIIQAYREKGVKVTLQQVMDANPGLNPKRLRMGQKVFIPDPSK